MPKKGGLSEADGRCSQEEGNAKEVREEGASPRAASRSKWGVGQNRAGEGREQMDGRERVLFLIALPLPLHEHTPPCPSAPERSVYTQRYPRPYSLRSTRIHANSSRHKSIAKQRSGRTRGRLVGQMDHLPALKLSGNGAAGETPPSSGAHTSAVKMQRAASLFSVRSSQNDLKGGGETLPLCLSR